MIETIMFEVTVTQPLPRDGSKYSDDIVAANLRDSLLDASGYPENCTVLTKVLCRYDTKNEPPIILPMFDPVEDESYTAWMLTADFFKELMKRGWSKKQVIDAFEETLEEQKEEE